MGAGEPALALQYNAWLEDDEELRGVAGVAGELEGGLMAVAPALDDSGVRPPIPSDPPSWSRSQGKVACNCTSKHGNRVQQRMHRQLFHGSPCHSMPSIDPAELDVSFAAGSGFCWRSSVVGNP